MHSSEYQYTLITYKDQYATTCVFMLNQKQLNTPMLKVWCALIHRQEVTSQKW